MSTAALEAYEVARVDELDPVAMWRYEGFVGLGFTEQQAERLAQTRGDDGVWLYPPDVKANLLDRGCPHDLAFDYLT